MIPKKIHYCWLGSAELPPLVSQCIDSWKNKLPEWELVLWNEENIPRDVPYINKAIEMKQYAFATDYLRFYVLHLQGGVYLDTDVEVIKDFSPLCSLAAFAAPEDIHGGLINAAVFGACKGHPLAKAMMDYYDGNHEEFGRDADLVVMVNCQIPSDDLIVHFF